MWEAVRKFLRPDETPAQTQTPGEQTAAQQANAAGEIDQGAPQPGQPPAAAAGPQRFEPPDTGISTGPTGSGDMGPGESEARGAADSSNEPGGSATRGPEVSPPGHAPQGLAAEPRVEEPPAAEPRVAEPGTGEPPVAEQPMAVRPDAAEADAAHLDAPHLGSDQPAEKSSPLASGLVPGAFPPAESVAAVEHTLNSVSLDQPALDSSAGQDAAAESSGAGGISTPEPSSFVVPELTVPSFEAPAVAKPGAGATQDTGPAPAQLSEVQETKTDEQTAAPSVEDSATTSAEAAPSTPAGAGERAELEPSAATEETAEAAPARPPSEAPAETPAAGAALTPLAAGTMIGDRYTITAPVAEESSSDAVTYRASDTKSYERCWSCGSADNGPSTRFCQNCGAPVQDHPVTLVQTREATGEPGEIMQEGAYFHVRPERRMFGTEGVGIEIGAYSAEGPHHPNEDSYWYVTRTLSANSGRRSTAIAVFADGMGGYSPGSGLISSRIASTIGKSILGELDDRFDSDAALDAAEAESIVRRAIAAANTMVVDEIARAGEMGSTLIAAIVHGDTAFVANIGDSRAYYVDPRGHVTAITRDQSLVAQEAELGHLSEDDIYTAPGNNIILHAIGEPDVQDAADWYVQPLEPGSFLMVCCDGYWKTLRRAVMPDDVPRETNTLSEAARRMVDYALTQGSDDNTTVLLIAVS